MIYPVKYLIIFEGKWRPVILNLFQDLSRQRRYLLVSEMSKKVRHDWLKNYKRTCY